MPSRSRSAVTVTGPDTPVSSSAGSGTATSVLPTRRRVEPRVGLENERPVAFDPSTATAVEGGVLVPFFSGVEPCSVLGRAEAVETADTVTIALFAGADPDAGDTACIEIAVEYEVVVARPALGTAPSWMPPRVDGSARGDSRSVRRRGARGYARLLVGNFAPRGPTAVMLPAPARTVHASEGTLMTDFSLELNEDQLQIQKWVHDFAADVIRPAAPEWDEREETPWPIIEEAAKIGLYSMDFIANAFGDPTGITFPMVSEELCWGDAGITLAIFGTTLGVSGIVGNGTPEQIGEWVPQCFGTARRHPHGRVRGERARRRLRRVVAAHARGLRRGEGRVGAQRHQDVDHQRRHHAGADACTSSSPRSSPS